MRRGTVWTGLLFAMLLAAPAGAQERIDFGRVFGDDLTKSIKAGDYDGVYRAMVRGFNPGKRYVDNKTPLMLSAVSEQPEIAGLLIEYGAIVQATDKLGNSALIYAAGAGSAEVAEVLLDNGAKIDERNRRGVSALIAAARNGHSYMAEILVERGADVTLTDHTGRSAREWAEENGHRSIARLLSNVSSRK